MEAGDEMRKVIELRVEDVITYFGIKLAAEQIKQIIASDNRA